MTQVSIPALPDPTAFVARLMGLPWEERAIGPDAFDCWGLVAHVQEHLHGRKLPWSGEYVNDAGVLRDVIDAMRANQLQRAWQPVDSPAAGDIVIMSKSFRPSHVGVWIELPDGTCGILHCERGRGVVLQNIAEARGGWARVEYRRCVEGALERLKEQNQEQLPTPENAALIVVKDPLNPLEGAEFRKLDLGLSVTEAVADFDTSACWVCLNFEPLLRRNPETGTNEWDERCVGPGDVLWVLPLLPEGGDDGSQLVASILSIVVAIVAPYVAPLLLPAGASATALSAVTAALTIGANFIIGQFVPQPNQPAPLHDPEPTYSFADLRNGLRPGANIPRPYGTLRRTPDFLARPYGEFEANEQYLNLILCIGLGDHDVLEFGVGDTKVWAEDNGFTGAIDDVEFEIIKPGGMVTLFAADVESNNEVDGIEMFPPDNDTGVVTLGPYTAVSSGDVSTRILLDFMFPRGLFSTDGDSDNVAGFVIQGPEENNIDNAHATWLVELRQIDDQDNPVSEWVPREEITYRAATLQAQRLTRTYDVAAGRYQVKVTRTSDLSATGNGQEQLLFFGLRANILSDTTIPEVTALAVRVRATAAATTAVQEWYVQSTAVLPHFSQTTGELVTGRTEAIEAAALDILRADYGLEMSDARIDLPTLKYLSGVWAARGDVCCTVIEDDLGCWEALERILTAGRTLPQFVGSTVTFVRDEDTILPSPMITHSDMVRGSFEIERAHHRRDKPNVVTMRYRDREGAMRTIDCPASNITVERRTTIDTKVHVDRAHAWRDGCFIAESNQLRRRYPKWTMLREGQSLVRGKRVSVSHPRPKWGAPSRVAMVDWPYIKLTGALNLTAGELGWLQLSHPDGTKWGPVAAQVGEDTTVIKVDEDDFAALMKSTPKYLDYARDPRGWIVSELTLEVPTDGSHVLDGQQVEATRASFGRHGMAAVNCKIMEILPGQDNTVEVLAVEDVAEVYLADQQPVPPEVSAAVIVNDQAPVWFNVLIAVMTTDLDYPDFAISVNGPSVPNAASYVIEIASSIEAGDWSERQSFTEPEFSVETVQTGDFVVRVAVQGTGLLGPWRYFTLTQPEEGDYQRGPGPDFSGAGN